MSKESRRYNKKNVWLIAGAIVLIILLLVWLTVAMFTGDTDVYDTALLPENASTVANFINLLPCLY